MPWGWLTDLIACFDLVHLHDMQSASSKGNAVASVNKSAALLNSIQKAFRCNSAKPKVQRLEMLLEKQHLTLQEQERQSRRSLPNFKPIEYTIDNSTNIQASEIKDNKGNPFTLRPPTTGKELEEIHKLFRNAAANGNGYATDEFTEEGLLNQRLLREVNTVGVYAQNGGAVIAAAVFGLSAIPRVPEKSCGGYVIVKEAHQRQGLGTQLLHLIEEHAKNTKREGLIFDVFLSNKSAIQWLCKEQYLITGTIPNAGVVKNRFTDTVLMYKDFNKVFGTFPFRSSL